MLALFKPWKNSLEELKGEDGTYKSTLEIFMYSKKFPSQKRAAILRAKRNDSFVDTSIDGYLNDNEFTPTTDRRNEELENAVENACSAPSVDNVDAFEDININLFNRLESRIPEQFDWSIDFDEQAVDWLSSYTVTFYQKLQDKILSGKSNTLQLFQEELHCPENCRSNAQKLLIFHHIYYHYQMELYEQGIIQQLYTPPVTG